jgi:hypothetical protein
MSYCGDFHILNYFGMQKSSRSHGFLLLYRVVWWLDANILEDQSQNHILLTVSQSVRLGFETLAGTHGHILAFKENFVFFCGGASTLTDGRVCHIKESQSLSVSCVCLYILLMFFYFLFYICLFFCIIYKGSMYMPGLSVRVLCSRSCLLHTLNGSLDT